MAQNIHKAWLGLSQPSFLYIFVDMKRIGYIAAAALTLTACNINKDFIEGPTLESPSRTKVVQISDEYSRNSFLVKIKQGSDESTLEGLRNAGAIQIERLFRENPARKDLESQFGLDRWYMVELGEDAVLDDVIMSAAEFESISMVEYNSIAKKASDCIIYPCDDPEPMTKAEAGELPFNDPRLVDQWHYYNQGNALVSQTVKKGADINVLNVWKTLTAGDPSIIVAVVDEGVKHTHKDLIDNMWKNSREIPNNGIDDDGNGYVDDIYGYNFVDDGPITWANDGDTGHGTHCAGTIAAVNNNGTGVSGVAGGSGKGDGCRIMSCQIFSGEAGGASSIVAKAVKYAADNGASIISCSFGFTSPMASDNAYIRNQGSAEIDAIHYFEACRNNPVLDGNIAIFAAGNEGHDYAHYPGAFHDIISVTAFGPDYLPTYYTNYGPGCNIVAPGGEAYQARSFKGLVLSTVPSELVQTQETTSSKGNDYGYMQGTSMACPHMSGIVALALSYAKKIGKTYTVQEFKNMIMTSANDLDSKLNGMKKYAYYQKDLDLGKFFHKLGTGAIDTWQLMMQIEGIPSIIAECGREQWLDISPYFGTASTSLTYLSVEVSDADKAALGLAADPYIKYGRLYVHPTKMGSGKIKVRVVGGGDTLGGGDNPPGGMEVTQEISIIAREFKSQNGGWL